MGLGVNRLCRFPSDFHILVFDSLVFHADGDSFLNLRDGFHSGLGGFGCTSDFRSSAIYFLQGFVQIFQRVEIVFSQIGDSFGNCLNIGKTAFVLSVARPVPAFLFSDIEILIKQSGKCRGCALFFHFSKSFFRGFAYISNPFKQRLDGFADGCHQTVGRFDVTVEITDIGFNAFAFHSRDSGSHVDCRDNINPLSGIRTHIHSFGTSGKLQIFILDNFPSVSPFLGVILFVPINSIFLMAFPSAGGKFDTLAVLVKVINLSALWHPLSIFINGSHSQHDVTMGIVSRWVGVMDCNITTHSFGDKVLLAVFL